MPLAAALLAAFVAPAHAEDAPGLYLPGASAWEAGSVEVGGGAASMGVSAIAVASDSAMYAEAAGAPTDAVALRGRLGVNLLGVDRDVEVTVPAGTLEARLLVVNRPHVRLAPWVATAWMGASQEPGLYTMVIGGLAFEAGGERVTFDASLPIGGAELDVAGGVSSHPLFGHPLLASEAGVRWRFDDGTSARLGFVGPAPSLVVRHEGERMWVEVGGATLVYVNAVRLAAGARF